MSDVPEIIAADPLAVEIWETLKGRLHEGNRWKSCYGHHLAVLVNAITRYYTVTAKLNAEGSKEILTNPKKQTVYRNPLLDVQSSYVNIIERFGRAFGLTPLADEKIKAVGESAVGELLKAMMAGPPMET